MILLAAGQAVLMALAFLAWPLWMCAIWMNENWSILYIVGIVLAHSGVMVLPIFLLRKRLLPSDVFLWCMALPVTSSMRCLAHLAVARLFLLPLSAAYLVSSIACWIEVPATHAVLFSALIMLIVSLALVLLFGTLILEGRYFSLLRQTRSKVSVAAPIEQCRIYHQQLLQPRMLQQWYRLFFLPFWRLENGIGLQQTFLLIGATILFGTWCFASTPFVRFLCCIGATSFALILTDQGVKAVQEQWQQLLPVLRALPFKLLPLRVLNSLLCLLPACVVLVVFSLLLLTRAGKFHVGVALWFTAMSLLAHLLLVSLVKMSSEGRARLLLFSIVLLSAFGSELWK